MRLKHSAPIRTKCNLSGEYCSLITSLRIRKRYPGKAIQGSPAILWVKHRNFIFHIMLMWLLSYPFSDLFSACACLCTPLEILFCNYTWTAVCLFCSQWTVLLSRWISLAALPGCLVEVAWPTLDWLSSGSSCSLPALTSVGSGPSTRPSSKSDNSNIALSSPHCTVGFCVAALCWHSCCSGWKYKASQ